MNALRRKSRRNSVPARIRLAPAKLRDFRLPVLTLPQLIQSKLACGLGNMRRTHKDFADVVEPIAIHPLDGAFARHWHRSVRKEFRELVRSSRGSSR